MSDSQLPEDELQAAMRVVRGTPTPEELAVVIALLQAAHSEELSLGHRVVAQPKSTWARNDRVLRSTLTPGFGQWAASYRPGLD